MKERLLKKKKMNEFNIEMNFLRSNIHNVSMTVNHRIPILSIRSSKRHRFFHWKSIMYWDRKLQFKITVFLMEAIIGVSRTAHFLQHHHSITLIWLHVLFFWSFKFQFSKLPNAFLCGKDFNPFEAPTRRVYYSNWLCILIKFCLSIFFARLRSRPKALDVQWRSERYDAI